MGLLISRLSIELSDGCRTRLSSQGVIMLKANRAHKLGVNGEAEQLVP
jgi:hypothetical protein